MLVFRSSLSLLWSGCLLIVRFMLIRRMIALVLVLMLQGCAKDSTGVQLQETQQRGLVVLRPSDAVVNVSDVSGQGLVMPDGVDVVLDNFTFESEIVPLLDESRQRSPGAIEMDATFSLRRDSLVIDVVQSPDGDATDVSKDYWVVEIAQIHSLNPR